MDLAFIAALIAVLGFTSGDIITALVTRKVSADKAVLIVTLLKTVTYIPFVWLWSKELNNLQSGTLIWILGLGILFTVSYKAFFKALEIGNATVVGVIAGVFPAVASLVSIVFLGERPSILMLFLLISVIGAAIWLGLNSDNQNKLKFDTGSKLALFVMIAWGFCFGLRKYPINQIGTEHAWLLVQFGIALTMTIFLFILNNEQAKNSLKISKYSGNLLWLIILAALTVGIGEGSESLALAKSNTTPVAIVSGSYPALYAVLSRFFFKDRVTKSQWIAIGYIAIVIVILGLIRNSELFI